MKRHHLRNQEGKLFIVLSEQLRFELESKMDMLWLTGQFNIYIKADFKSDLLVDEYKIMINCVKDVTDSIKLAVMNICSAIKVWYEFSKYGY
ncbi:hypothetical protein [Pedobacter sp. L105]|uniref:hypothetical protein n=1 Tax=Pedobacter sp. L105 TaxID=1641871 RepID=UPI00131BB765|nr:hypothetical protein [Pedobacter sp. L105]